MSRGLRAWTALGAVALIGAFSESASGEPRARIVLVAPSDALERVAGRLRAELEELGFEVVELPGTRGSPIHRSLEAAARGAGAFAAVRLESSAARVEVWIADRVTGKTVLREIVLGSGESPEEVVALRAVELLRASLVELDLPQPVRGDAPVRPELRAILPERARPPTASRASPPSALQLGLGPATALSTGGLDPRPAVWVSAATQALPPLRAELFATWSVGTARVRAVEGSADVALFILGGSVSREWRLDERWSCAVGVGLAVAHVRIEGAAEPPLLDRTVGVTAALPHWAARLQYSLGGRVWLGVDLRAGLAIPRPVVRFVGREVASWGRPVFLVALPLDLDVG